MDRPGAFATLRDKGRAGCRCGAGHADGLTPSLSYVLRDALRGKALFWLGVALCAASAAAPASTLSIGAVARGTLGIGAVARYAALALGAVCVSRATRDTSVSNSAPTCRAGFGEGILRAFLGSKGLQRSNLRLKKAVPQTLPFT